MLIHQGSQHTYFHQMQLKATTQLKMQVVGLWEETSKTRLNQYEPKNKQPRIRPDGNLRQFSLPCTMMLNSRIIIVIKHNTDYSVTMVNASSHVTSWVAVCDSHNKFSLEAHFHSLLTSADGLLHSSEGLWVVGN